MCSGDGGYNGVCRVGPSADAFVELGTRNWPVASVLSCQPHARTANGNSRKIRQSQPCNKENFSARKWVVFGSTERCLHKTPSFVLRCAKSVFTHQKLYSVSSPRRLGRIYSV